MADLNALGTLASEFAQAQIQVEAGNAVGSAVVARALASLSASLTQEGTARAHAEQLLQVRDANLLDAQNNIQALQAEAVARAAAVSISTLPPDTTTLPNTGSKGRR